MASSSFCAHTSGRAEPNSLIGFIHLDKLAGMMFCYEGQQLAARASCQLF
jgi:hypothetical protein